MKSANKRCLKHAILIMIYGALVIISNIYVQRTGLHWTSALLWMAKDRQNLKIMYEMRTFLTMKHHIACQAFHFFHLLFHLLILYQCINTLYKHSFTCIIFNGAALARNHIFANNDLPFVQHDSPVAVCFAQIIFHELTENVIFKTNKTDCIPFQIHLLFHWNKFDKNCVWHSFSISINQISLWCYKMCACHWLNGFMQITFHTS